MPKPKVTLIGLDPDVVVYDRWPGMTPEKLLAALNGDTDRMRTAGYDASICFVDHGATAEATVRAALAANDVDCILIGAGVRTDPAEFLLFETLINVAHQAAPKARICFNTGPTDSMDAVQRWV
jgi:nucleotide-binding universal stress UspA family protein